MRKRRYLEGVLIISRLISESSFDVDSWLVDKFYLFFLIDFLFTNYLNLFSCTVTTFSTLDNLIKNVSLIQSKACYGLQTLARQ